MRVLFLVFIVLCLLYVTNAKVDVNDISTLPAERKLKSRRYIMQTKYDPLDGKKLDITLCGADNKYKNTENIASLQSIIISTDQPNNEVSLGANVIIEVLWKEKSNTFNVSSSHVVVLPYSGSSPLTQVPWDMSRVSKHEEFEMVDPDGVKYKFHTTYISGKVPKDRLIKPKTYTLKVKSYPNGEYDGCYMIKNFKIK